MYAPDSLLSSFMSKRLLFLFVAFTLAFMMLLVTYSPTWFSPAVSSSNLSASSDQQQLLETYGRIPLSFEVNQGQTDSQVKFLSRGNGYNLFLTGSEAVLVLSKPTASIMMKTEANSFIEQAVLRMQLVGANPKSEPVGVGELPGKVNYFFGKDPKKWRAGIPSFARVKYEDAYPGIDLVYYGNQQQLEYDFVVTPGADPSLIRLNFEGTDELEVDSQGNLVLHIAGEQVKMLKPLIYQDPRGVRQAISGEYVLKSEHEVGFQISAYDATSPLVIDPILLYSTYLGGTADDQAAGISVDNSGNIYVTGNTRSADFPTENPVQPGLSGDLDAFVLKLNTNSNVLVYSTFLGGSLEDVGHAIAVDSNGAAYVAGFTASSEFPTTPGAFDTNYNGGLFDAFVAKLDASGSSLLYSTFLGGSAWDSGNGIVVDSSGSAYIMGFAYSSNFPTTSGAFDTSFNGGSYDAFITKLNPTGTGLVYSTYLGGNGDEWGGRIALGNSGEVYVTGYTWATDFPTTSGAFQPTYNGGLVDVFVSRLNAGGTALLYSTYLGGDLADFAFAIAVDESGAAYITGWTPSSNFPTTPGAFDQSQNGNYDAFVTKLSVDGTSLAYSTFLGGNFPNPNFGPDHGFGITVDEEGAAYITGRTGSYNFPITTDAFDTTCGTDGSCDPNLIGHPGGDAFLTKLNASGTGLLYSTFLGGEGNDEGRYVAVDAAGAIYVVGFTASSEFPTTQGAFDTSYNGGPNDVFVVKIGVNQPPICSGAVASTSTLWPPNHKFKSINVLGVTDPNGEPIMITIDNIFQDEAVNAPDSGNTAPDGQGVGMGTAQVRAERVSGGNGRFYHISFTADDGLGGTCTGKILVSVPPNQSSSAVNEGALYDSTVP